MSTVKWAGVAFAFNSETTLVIPPLSLGDAEQLKDKIGEFRGLHSQHGTAIDVVHAALKRNYPAMTRDEVGNLIDMRNALELWKVVMGVAGMDPKTGDPSGEAQAP